MKLYIGENLKRLRNEKNVTQDTLAEYLGVTYQAVSRWENGLAYPDIELLPELARFFEVSLEELMGTESDEEKIRHEVSECLTMNEDGDKTNALSKLRALEREFPGNWHIKQAICRVLTFPAPESYDEVLPELRRYAVEGQKKCTMKDTWAFRYIVYTLIKAVPEEEVKEWTKYIPASQYPNYNSVLEERYRERNNTEKAKHYCSESIRSNMFYLTMQFENYENTPDGNILSRSYANNVLNAVIGEPYVKEGKLHNTIMIWERAVNQTQLAAGYAGSGQTEQGLDELEKAVDLWIVQADALKDEYFVSDSPYLEPQKNRWFDKYQGVDYGIDALTNEAEWGWFDPIRTDPRFNAQLDRLLAKKAELEEYWRTHDISAE